MNHDIRLEVINADVECGKRDGQEGERGDVHTYKVVRKLALEKNNKECHAINSRDNRRLNLKLCKINPLFKNNLYSLQFHFTPKGRGNS